MSTEERKVQLGFVAKNETKPGLDAIKSDVREMAAAVAESGTKAAAGIAKIGDGGGDAAQKLDRSTKSIIGSVERATAALQAGERGSAKYFETLASQRGVNSDALKPYLEQLRQAEKAQQIATGSLNGMTVSAKQTAAALRGVPAQFTDIVTSLQGGQAPLTVLLQQGGQLKDMFGGAGNAAKALGGYIVGLVNPYTLAAAAVVALGVAMAHVNSQDAEFAGLSTRLAATGRATVSSVTGLRDMVTELSKVPGVSRSAATSILDEFSKVQGVGGAIFRGLGASVADFAAATGTDLPTAAKKLAAAFADPAKGVKDLESALGTLTAEQILAIESMAALGDKAGAQRAMLEALKEAVGGVGGPMTDLGKATDRLSNSWDGLVQTFAQSEGLRTANTLLASVIDKFTWLLNNAPSTMFGPLGYMVGSIATGVGKLTGASAPANTGGASGSWGDATGPAVATDIERQVKAALDATKAFKSQAGALGELKAQAKVARDALALLEGQNKGGSEAAAKLRDSLAGINERMEALNKKGSAGAVAATKAATDQYNTLALSIRARIALADEELKFGRKLTEAEKQEIQLIELLDSAKNKLGATQRKAIIASAEEAKAKELLLLVQNSEIAYAKELATLRQSEKNTDYAQSASALREINDAYAKGLAGVNAQITALKDEAAAAEIARTQNVSLAQAVEQLAIARLQERQAKFNEGSEGWQALQKEIEQRKELRGLIAAKDVRSEWADVWASVDKTAQSAFTNIFEGGQSTFKKLGNTLKSAVLDLLYQMTIKKWIINVGASVTGAASGTASAAGGGGSGLDGSGLLGAAGQAAFGYSAGASAASLAYANAVGALGGDALGALIAANGSWAAVGTSAAGLASSIGSFAAAAGPWALAAMAVYSLVKKFDTSGTPHVGSLAEYSEAGGLKTSQTHGAFGMGFGGVDYNEGAATLVQGVSKTIVGILDSTAKAFGQAAGYSVATGFADDSSKDGAWGGLLIKQMENIVVNWADTRSSKWAPKEFADGEAGQKEYLAALSKSVLGALKDMDLPGWAQSTLDALGESPALDALAAAVDQINTTKAALKQMGDALTGFAGMSDDAVTALIKASGGIAGLSANASTYFQNFYSEAERQAVATKQVSDAMAKVNLTLPTSRDEYRKLVEQYTAMGADGASTLAVLLALSGAFAAITPAADQAAIAVGDTLDKALARLRNPARSVDDIAKNTIGLEDKLFQTENKGNTEALREREIKGLTDNEKAIQRRIWAIEDETEKTAVAAQKAAAIANEKSGLERQLLELNGDTAGIRALERAALDESNRALYDHINAIKDEQAAAAAAAAKTAAIASEKAGLDRQLLELNGDTAGIRALERAALDESNRALYDHINALKDEKSAAAAAAAAVAAAANEHASLQDRLWQIQGNTAALRAAALAKLLDDQSRDMQRAIWAAEDNAAAQQAAQQAAQASASAAEQAAQQQAAAAQQIKAAWQSVSDSVLDEVKRIRGLMTSGSAQGYSGAQAAFAIATAQARAGDQDAAKSLPGLSKAMLDLAETNVGSMLELRRIQAATAASLELTNASIAQRFGLTVPSLAVGTNNVPHDMLLMAHAGEAIVPRAYNPALTGGSSSGSDDTSALIAEVRALREEVAALRQSADKTAANTLRAAQDLDEFSREGIPVINQPNTELATA